MDLDIKKDEEKEESEVQGLQTWGELVSKARVNFFLSRIFPSTIP